MNAYIASSFIGPLIGKRLQKLHEEKGVHFILSAEVTELLGDEDDNLSEVVLNTGQTLRADLLLVGVGVLPCTDFIRGSNIRLNSKGYVPVNEVIFLGYKFCMSSKVILFEKIYSPRILQELVRLSNNPKRHRKMIIFLTHFHQVSLNCPQYMMTNCQDVYAAGDIASFPFRDSPKSAIESVSVGHWQMALHHGRTVGMLSSFY